MQELLRVRMQIGCSVNLDGFHNDICIVIVVEIYA